MLNLIISVDTLEVIAGVSVMILCTEIAYSFAMDYIAHQQRVAKEMDNA